MGFIPLVQPIQPVQPVQPQPAVGGFTPVRPKILVNEGLEQALATQRMTLYPEGKDLADHFAEGFVQGPATMAKFFQGFLEGSTLGLAKWPTPNADAFLAERSRLGEETTGEFAKWAGEVAGEFVPIGLAYKAGLGLLAKGGLPTSVVMREIGAGAYAGLIYGVAKGIAEGKSVVDVLAQGGWGAASWSTMGAIVGKITTWIGGRPTKDAIEKATLKLAKEIKVSKEKAKAIVAQAVRAVNNPPTVEPVKPKWTPEGMPGMDVSGRPVGPWSLTGEYQGPKPGLPLSGKVEASRTALGTFRRPLAEPSGWPGAGVPEVQPPQTAPSQTAPFRVSPIRPLFTPTKPLQIVKEDIIFIPPEAGQVGMQIPTSAIKKPGAPPETVTVVSKALTKPRVKPEVKPKVLKGRPEHLLHPEGPTVGPKGLPIVEISKEELAEVIQRQKIRGIPDYGNSVKDRVDEEIIELYSGLPIDQVRPLLRRLKLFLGKREKTGDLPLWKVALSSILSPEELAKVRPETAAFVTDVWHAKHSTERVFVNEFMRLKDRFLKDLTKGQKEQVAVLLHNYNKSTDIPIEIGVKLEPAVSRGFTSVRRLLDTAWSAFVQNKVNTLPLKQTEKNVLSRLLIHYNKLEQVPPAELQTIPAHIQGLFNTLRKSHAVPRKVSGYLTRIFNWTDDLTEEKATSVIRNFAEEHGLDYMLALRLLQKKIPKQGQFFPLSKERVLPKAEIEDLLLNLDQILDFYIKGTGRKMFLDTILPAANLRLASIPEGSAIHTTMLHYVDRLRGLPSNVVELAATKRPWLMRVLRAEALHQFISKIGVNPSATFFNMTQYPLMDGAKFLSMAMRDKSLQPLGDFGYGAMAVLLKRGRLAAHRAGVVFDVGKAEIPLRDTSGLWNKVAKVLGSAFIGIERYNKTASYNANLRLLERTLKGLAGLTASERYRLIQRGAVKGVGETQYFMGVEARPSALAGPVGSTVGRFKIFPIKTLERIAHMDKYELLAFLGILDVLGGPDAIPGLRQLRYELNQEFPDSLTAKVLGKMGVTEEVSDVLNIAQRHSLAGLTGIDIGAVTGLGFIPGGSITGSWHENYSRRFWQTIGSEVEGPTIGDARNLWRDLASGEVDLRDKDVQELLALRSGNTINVSVRRTARAIQEWKDKYVGYNRQRPGPALTDFDVITRALGFPSVSVNRQQQVTADFTRLEQEAFKEKFKIEDRIIDLNDKLEVEVNPKKRSELVDKLGVTMLEWEAFNTKYIPRVGIRITANTVREAVRNRFLPLEQRVAGSRLQEMLIQEKLKRALERTEEEEE